FNTENETSNLALNFLLSQGSSNKEIKAQHTKACNVVSKRANENIIRTIAKYKNNHALFLK
ncbi:hypothetical protein L1D58_25745, partial [Vibrio diabolicus]|uniref:hypothetical protein n=1 Tax=Vibrio diabolicus TaxID=50719 RepID=UPI00211AA59B